MNEGDLKENGIVPSFPFLPCWLAQQKWAERGSLLVCVSLDPHLFLKEASSGLCGQCVTLGLSVTPSTASFLVVRFACPLLLCVWCVSTCVCRHAGLCMFMWKPELYVWYLLLFYPLVFKTGSHGTWSLLHMECFM